MAVGEDRVMMRDDAQLKRELDDDNEKSFTRRDLSG